VYVLYPAINPLPETYESRFSSPLNSFAPEGEKVGMRGEDEIDSASLFFPLTPTISLRGEGVYISYVLSVLNECEIQQNPKSYQK
jgi:hypothetical protein